MARRTTLSTAHIRVLPIPTCNCTLPLLCLPARRSRTSLSQLAGRSFTWLHLQSVAAVLRQTRVISHHRASASLQRLNKENYHCWRPGVMKICNPQTLNSGPVRSLLTSDESQPGCPRSSSRSGGAQRCLSLRNGHFPGLSGAEPRDSRDGQLIRRLVFEERRARDPLGTRSDPSPSQESEAHFSASLADRSLGRRASL